jgi:hypothetical protein
MLTEKEFIDYLIGYFINPDRTDYPPFYSLESKDEFQIEAIDTLKLLLFNPAKKDKYNEQIKLFLDILMACVKNKSIFVEPMIKARIAALNCLEYYFLSKKV